VKAYLGITSDKAPKYWLIFHASVPPMGWNSYYISKPTGAGESYLFGLNCNYEAHVQILLFIDPANLLFLLKHETALSITELTVKITE
jgi:hypothetical protein